MNFAVGDIVDVKDKGRGVVIAVDEPPGMVTVQLDDGPIVTVPQGDVTLVERSPKPKGPKI